MSLSLRVGQLAARAGVTVRALHHYEAAGLLAPDRTPTGHRRYGAAEVERLQQIVSLRSLGLGLDAIRRTLDAPGFDPAAVVAQQRAVLAADLDRLGALDRRLGDLERLLRRRAEAGTPISPDTFLTLTTIMNDILKHYTPDQLQQLAERRDALGDDAIREVEAEWPRLFASLGAEMDAATDPAAPAVQTLVARWDELVAMFTGGDAGIERSLGDAWEASGDQMAQMNGLSSERMRALFAYAQRARDAQP
ncbi:MAG: MerR family transcriptional regulator [Bacteroidota bacterium]